MVEILTTIVIVFIAILIIYKNFKKKIKGKCHCGSCTSKCPQYNKNNE